jgi:hypothetical protein
VRRLLARGPLGVAHVVFAPAVDRPLLLGWVRLRNAGGEPLVVGYTEIWEVGAGRWRAAPGAAERTTAEGVLALVDTSSATRARAPDPSPARGLALEARVVLPPGAVRHLAFAYAAAGSAEEAGLLARAWRGEVRGELERTALVWSERLAGSDEPVAAYRRRVLERLERSA